MGLSIFHILLLLVASTSAMVAGSLVGHTPALRLRGGVRGASKMFGEVATYLTPATEAYVGLLKSAPVRTKVRAARSTPVDGRLGRSRS